MEYSYRDQLGSKAWVILVSYVLGYDIWAIRGHHETLSGAFWRALNHPQKRWVVLIAWAITTKHLVFPQVLAERDPFNVVASVIRKGATG